MQPSCLPSSTTAPLAGLSGKVICILDDHEDTLRYLATILKRARATTVTFTNPIAAVDYLRENQPDLVVIDIMMPLLDGWEVFSRLRSCPRHFETPVLFLSCLFEAGDEARVNEAEDRCRIQAKPISPRDLIEAATGLLN